MTEQVISKTCRTCKQMKPISEFYKAARNRDGFRNDCKNCCLKYRQTEKGKASQKRYRQTDKSKATEKRYKKRYRKSEKGKATIKRHAQSEKGKAARKRYNQSEESKAARKRYRQSEEGKETQKRFKVRYPEQYQAHKAVEKAIREGQLPWPDSLQCHYCPAQAKQYHHHKGYEPEHWLDVVPVCIKCHGKIHHET